MYTLAGMKAGAYLCMRCSILQLPDQLPDSLTVLLQPENEAFSALLISREQTSSTMVDLPSCGLKKIHPISRLSSFERQCFPLQFEPPLNHCCICVSVLECGYMSTL